MVQFVDSPVTEIMELGYLIIDLQHSVAEVAEKVIHCADQPCPVDIPVVDRGIYLGLVSLREVLRQIIERSRDDLYYLAYFDPLTNLPNRALFNDRLEQACHRASRAEFCFALAFVDLDYFKQINDVHGHHIGDQVLQLVSQRLQASLRESDTVARLAGDEFVLILSNIRDATDIARITDNIRTNLLQAMPEGLETISLSASIGIALCPLDDTTPHGLMLKADAAMYEAKGLGRNRHALYSVDCRVPADLRQSLARHISKAVDYDELTLVYQPVISLQTNEIISVEALLRWRHPDLGLMMPSKFLALAESAGAMDHISNWVIASACQQQQRWVALGLPMLRVSVNLAPVHYRSEEFCDTVERVFSDHGVDPRHLEFEATEKMLKAETRQGLKNLTRLHELGVGIGVDDFGLGFCRLEHLRRLPVSHLKIDGSIVRNVHASRTSIALLQTITRIADHLQLRLIAEAVESRDEAECLLTHQCHVAQGHIFGQPQTGEQFEHWYRNVHPDLPLQ